MINWPQTLVTELAERRCIIFLGAGASAGSISIDGTSKPPNWENLLTKMAGLVSNASHRTYAENLIIEKQYLDAAQVIHDNSNNADRNQFYRNIFDLPKYQPSEIHKLVHELDPKIVITTNYDQIYDNYCRQGSGAQGYNVCKYYEPHALNDIRSNIRCVLKAHGCTSDPTRLVLTRASYFEARRNYPSFYRILDSLFLTSTILFIGVGLSDPDIQLVLENAHIAAPSVHTHYALVESGKHPSIISTILNTNNITLLEYSKGDHHLAIAALQDLLTQVIAYRSVPT